MRSPRSWSEAFDRLTRVLADEPSGREWVRQILETRWGVTEPVDLQRRTRAFALQKLAGVVMALEDLGYDLAFDTDQRQRVAATFARFFGGYFVDGPPWRLSPTETDRPTREAWLAESVPF